ncbi:MAG TPA: substrate-binding domain-containing protein [bacterium]
MRRALGVFSFVVAVAVSAPLAHGASEPRLVASGCSVSNVGYLADLAADYEKLTGVRMFVRGGGSVIGLEDLASGRADLAASCRGRIAADPLDVEFIQVAWDALVFLVHPSNPIDSISFADAAGVFGGTLRDWRRLGGPAGPIQVFLQRPTTGLSGVESSIRALVLKGAPPSRGSSVAELASTGIVEQLIEKTPAGFGASGYSSARRRAVKMLALDGVRPTRTAIIDRSYPLRRPLYLIVKTPPRAEVKAFVNFALSARGQQLIDSYGVIPLRTLR